MFEAVLESVGAHRRAQVRRECGYWRAAAAPHIRRGWNAKQREDLHQIRTLRARGGYAEANTLASVLAGQRLEAFWDGVFLACRLVPPGTPQSAVPAPGLGLEGGPDVEGQGGRMLAAVRRQRPPQESLAVGR